MDPDGGTLAADATGTADAAGATDELAAAFAADGVVCVRGALDPAEVAVAARAVDAVLAGPGPFAVVASGADDPGMFTEDFCRWRDIPEIAELARRSRVPQIAAALMATPQVRFYHDHVLVKEGGTTQRTPWHQDQPYYNVDGRGVSAWIPVDPVPEAGCLELVAGTHRGPWLMPRTFLSGEARWFPEGSLAELPDIEADRGAFDIRRFALAPGDAIFFDFLTVHGAPGFPYPGRRRVLSLRYLSAAARHAPRRWRTSPPFNALEDELAPGAPMDHPLFPIVWPR
jgi:ectoine hydroxylase-related dioxygenase (phytanoyl-CoA dioxygenase family)